MKKLERKIIITLTLSVLSLIACFVLNSSWYKNRAIEAQMLKVEQSIIKETEYYNTIANELFAKDTLLLQDFQPYFTENFTIEYFDKKELKLWSNRKYLPETLIQRYPSNGSFIIPFENRSYHLVKQENENEVFAFVRQLTNENRTIVNENLQVPIALSTNQSDDANTSKIIDDSNETFYIEAQAQQYKNQFLMVAWFAFVIGVFTFLYLFFSKTRLNFPRGVRFIIMLAVFMLFIWFVNSDPFQVFHKLNFFSPEIWANKYLAPSLGHLYIKVFSLALVVNLWYNYPMVLKGSKLANEFKILITSAEIGFLSFLFIYFSRSSIIDVSTTFLDGYQYKWLLFGANLSIGFMYYVIVLRLVRFVNNLKKITSVQKALFLIMCAIVTFVLLLIAIPVSESIQFSLWVIAFLLLIFVTLDQDNKLSSLRQILVSILVFSLFGTYCMQLYSSQAEKSRLNQIARKLIVQNDFDALFEISELNEQIQKDRVLQSQVSLPFFSEKDIIDRIKAIYLVNKLPNYHKEIRVEIESKDIGEYQAKTTTLQRHYDEFVIENYVPILAGDKTIHIQMMLTRPKFFNTDIKFSSSLRATESVINFDDISYYVSEGKKIVDAKGSVNDYDEDEYQQLKVGAFEYINKTNGKRNYVYKYAPQKLLFISLQKPKIADNSLNTLAYIFTLIVSFYLLLMLCYSLFNINRIEFYQKSVVNRAQFVILVFVYVASIIIGLFTYRSLKNKINDFQTNRYVDELNVITSEVQVKVNHQQDVENYLLLNYSSPSKHIYYYDARGNFIFENSSVINEGVWHENMNPIALLQFETAPQQYFVLNETLPDKRFKGVYQRLRDKKMKTLGYLYIPEYISEYEQKEESEIYLNLLYNTFSLVLFLITFLSIFLMGYFGRIFERIRKQFSKAGIGAEMQIIEWKNEDEIGLLVREYNEMVAKLDKSAVALARSEREAAWKDMAKQIAHEIKNPLTPMKLSIQHLKMRLEIDNNERNEKVIRTLNNLEVQIAHLANIANDFSSIAKMASPELRQINFTDVITEVVEIFSHSNNYTITFNDFVGEPAIIKADYTQINRVITNLVKNATQAVSNGFEGIIDLALKQNDSKQYELTVADNGKGIPVENRAKIFTPNFTTKKSGTGIGLMMSKKIIETHGGEISFTSQVGEGTVFKIVIEQDLTDR